MSTPDHDAAKLRAERLTRKWSPLGVSHPATVSDAFAYLARDTECARLRGALAEAERAHRLAGTEGTAVTLSRVGVILRRALLSTPEQTPSTSEHVKTGDTDGE